MPITASSGSAAFAKARPDLDGLIKRRFFYRQAFEIYGGVAGFYTYGPPGAAVKQNLLALWRKHFVIEENLMEVDDTNIMPHDVLFTSGHVERFNDFIVKDSSDANRFWRADKLLEEVMEAKMADKACTPEQKVEYQKVHAQADAYSAEQLSQVFAQYGIKAPESGAELTPPEEFNLMFATPIGPSGMIQGYLRPETAQGIFLNFKFCLEQNNYAMPFGIAQVGKAFRNEIAPRSGLIRQREFTQAEIEYFVHPQKKAHPKFAAVGSLQLELLPSPQQLAAQPAVRMSLAEAVAAGTVANETLGFFIGRTYQFLVRAGCKAEHIRFRQHLPDEMAHYACDCWDAEIEMSLGWVECVGIADRSAYDLTVHAKATNTPLIAEEPFEVPVKVERYGLSKKAAAALGKSFKKDAKRVAGKLDEMSAEELKALKATAEAEGKASLTVSDCGGSDTFEIANELLVFEATTTIMHVEKYTPNVIEPSFGIDRILTAIYEHTYSVRAKEGDAPEEPPPKKGDKKDSATDAKPGVLAFPPEVAPYKCVVLPLDMRIVRECEYAGMRDALRATLSEQGLQYKVDESGASIGKRYARSDELGIPFAITIDEDCLKQFKADAASATATLRERDSTRQVRLPLSTIAQTVAQLCSASSLTWDELDADFAGTGADPKVAYLKQMGVEEALSAAVTALAKEKPADPMKWLSARFAAL